MGAGASWLRSDRSTPAGTAAGLISQETRVTNLGNVVRATIAGDGRSLVYAAMTGSRESLWAKGLDSGTRSS